MLKAEYKKHTLKLKFDAGTSRGIIKERDVWYVKVHRAGEPGIYGIGECAPLQGLSPDHIPDFEDALSDMLESLEGFTSNGGPGEALNTVSQIVPAEFPSIRFGIETALLDLNNGGRRMIFENDFFYGKKSIPINGLIWMGDKVSMVRQVREKIKAGYRCIKIKIGALDFREECEILDYIRVQYSGKKPELRVDANGAFLWETVMEKLYVLKDLDIHSIEQPIKAGEPDRMASLCAMSPVPIALDEELIGYDKQQDKVSLLEKIRPSYIVLKPTLLGGFSQTAEWIEIAEDMGIGWWITSALESNIGLNAIAQFTASFKTPLRQGLGTGMLFHNNIDSPLVVQKGALVYDPTLSWSLDIIDGKDEPDYN
jgi:o-succinylbenzoate synthase